MTFAYAILFGKVNRVYRLASLERLQTRTISTWHVMVRVFWLVMVQVLFISFVFQYHSYFDPTINNFQLGHNEREFDVSTLFSPTDCDFVGMDCG
jgi:Tfp pilus assembly protein PilO